MNRLLEPLLGATKVARLLGIEEQTLGAWRRRGYGPRWYRVGKKVKYAEEDLRAWLDAQSPELNPSESGGRCDS